MNWFYLRFSAFSDSVFRLIKQPITSILHILGMGIALSIPMGCYMLLDGADQFSRKLNNTSQLNVFITANSSDETIKIAEKQLTELFEGEINFIDQDEGLKELSKNPKTLLLRLRHSLLGVQIVRVPVEFLGLQLGHLASGLPPHDSTLRDNITRYQIKSRYFRS